MSDPGIIDQAIEEVKAGQEPSVGKIPEAEEPKVLLNNEMLTLDQADKVIRAIRTAYTGVESFDHTKPRIIEPVPINIGGKERHLTLPFWALKKFQDTTKISPWDHSKVWAIPADLDLTVTLLWCALLDENPDLTLDEVWRFQGLDFGNIHYIRYCLDECWGRNNPDPEAPSVNGAEGTTDPNSRSRRRAG